MLTFDSIPQARVVRKGGHDPMGDGREDQQHCEEEDPAAQEHRGKETVLPLAQAVA